MIHHSYPGSGSGIRSNLEDIERHRCACRIDLLCFYLSDLNIHEAGSPVKRIPLGPGRSTRRVSDKARLGVDQK